ncbi:MAG: Gldg family protein [Deltaproteobacteria bacterium]
MGGRTPILGISGIVFVFFAILAHYLTKQPGSGLLAFNWYSLVHLAGGLGCLVAYFMGGSASVGDFIARRSTRFGANALVYSILFLTVVVMLNFMASRYHYRVDMSVAGVNSLSQQSREVLDRIQGEVHVDAFIEGGRDTVLEELFSAYRYYSDKVTVRFIDPQIHPELAQTALITHVPSLKVYLGENKTVITKTDEESVTNAIHRVSGAVRKKIYFVEGHGEAPISDSQTAAGMGLFAGALRKQNYDVEGLFLPEVDSVPSDAAVVVASAGPRPWFPHEIDALDRYLRGGGRLLVLLEPRGGERLVEFLSTWGVRVGDDVIVDQQVRLFQGPTLGLEPVVSQYGKHPAVEPMTQRTVFSLVRSVRPTAQPPAGLALAPLALTAATSWAETDLDRLFDQSEAELSDDDFKGPVPIGMAVSGLVKDLGGTGVSTTIEGTEKMAELAVFGDSTFVTNKYWRQMFNDALALSTMGWLAGEEQFISIGPRAIRASRARLSPAQAVTVFYLSVLVIPELILLAGIAVWWRRSSL